MVPSPVVVPIEVPRAVETAPVSILGQI